MGLGLVALGSEDLNLYEELKNILFTNQAVTGEAAALGISLLMAGTGNQEVFIKFISISRLMLGFPRAAGVREGDPARENHSGDRDGLCRHLVPEGGTSGLSHRGDA